MYTCRAELGHFRECSLFTGCLARGSRAQLAGIAKKFAEHGYVAVAISYRLAPQSTFPRKSTIAKPLCAGCARTRTNSKSIRSGSAVLAIRQAAT